MSASTRLGWWKAPTRFLPCGVLMPVLPPTEESTCASSVVGTCTKRTPRRTRLAAKPARSPITPPPSATTRSPRSSPISSRRSHRRASDREALGGLAGRQHHRAGMPAARGQRLLQRAEMMLGNVGVSDDGAARGPEAGVDQICRPAPAGRYRSGRHRSARRDRPARLQACPPMPCRRGSWCEAPAVGSRLGQPRALRQRLHHLADDHLMRHVPALHYQVRDRGIDGIARLHEIPDNRLGIASPRTAAGCCAWSPAVPARPCRP